MKQFHFSLLLGLLLTSTSTAQPEKAAEEIRANGIFVPERQVTLTSEAAGRVAEVLIKEGQTVKKGQAVVRMERTRQTAELQRVEGMMQTAAARLRLADNRGREAAQGELATAKAEVERARAALDATEIRAPFDGLILRVNVDVGTFSNPAMIGLAVTAGLCDLADVSSWRVETAVAESEIGRVKIGQRCLIYPTVGARKALDGKVTAIAAVVERGRGTVAVTIKADLPADFTPRVNAAAQVRILLKE